MVGLKIKGLKVSKRMRELAKEGRAARVAKVRKANRTPRPPNQWQKNLTAWNAGNSGWCIPKRGTAEHAKVKNFHIRQGLEVGTPPTPSRRLDFYDRPTPEQLTSYPRGEVVEEMEKLRREVRAMRESL